MKIKALSLWEPHATLFRLRLRRFETRSWATNYRGLVLICAAKETNVVTLIGVNANIVNSMISLKICIFTIITAIIIHAMPKINVINGLSKNKLYPVGFFEVEIPEDFLATGEF